VIKDKPIDNIMGLLTGKTALVTGASRGIGKAIALKFAAEGANVAFTYLSNSEYAKVTEEAIVAMGVKAKAYASNASDFACISPEANCKIYS
jgi:3-oxoacyl-[acyl-carrier protein] reductase